MDFTDCSAIFRQMNQVRMITCSIVCRCVGFNGCLMNGQKCGNVCFQMNPLKLFVCIYVIVWNLQWVFSVFFNVSQARSQVSLRMQRCQMCRTFRMQREIRLEFIQQNVDINCNEQMEAILCQVCCGVAHINISPFVFSSLEF